MPRQSNNIEGVIVPLLTPLDQKEHVDELALRALIRHCLEGGVDGIFVGGTTGFGPLLTDVQWVRLMEIAHDEVGDTVPLLGGIIAPSTARAIERVQVLDQIGFQHMVVTPTFYVLPVRETEFLTHFDACRQASAMNMIVYNIPSCTGAFIPVNTITQMIQEGWTRTVKESSGNRDYFRDLASVMAEAELVLLQGNEPDIAWGFSIGASGCVPACGNYVPGLFAAAWHANRNKDEIRLAELQERIMAVREILLMGEKSWLAGAMYGVHTLGIGSGHVPRPIQGLNNEQKEEIEALAETGPISDIIG